MGSNKVGGITGGTLKYGIEGVIDSQANIPLDSFFEF